MMLFVMFGHPVVLIMVAVLLWLLMSMAIAVVIGKTLKKRGQR